MALSGDDSVSLQGEDKAMKRYRSLNMNGDVVAKVRKMSNSSHISKFAFLINLINAIRYLINGKLIFLITYCSELFQIIKYGDHNSNNNNYYYMALSHKVWELPNSRI